MQTLAPGVELLDLADRPGMLADLDTPRPPRVLAVDDDAINRFAVAQAFQRLKGVVPEPHFAYDGEGALGLSELYAYDAILLDIEMPGIDGFEFLSNLRQTSLNRATPVVFVTRHNDPGTRARIVREGSDLIPKPFPIPELTVKVLTMLITSRIMGSYNICISRLTNPERSGSTPGVWLDPCELSAGYGLSRNGPGQPRPAGLCG